MANVKMVLVCVSLVGMENTVRWKDVQTVVQLMDNVGLTVMVCGNVDATTDGMVKTAVFY